MGLLDNITSAINTTLKGLEGQTTAKSKVSVNSVANELISLGDQLSEAGKTDTDSHEVSSGFQAYRGQESGNTVLVRSDLNSQFHDGDASFLV